MNPMQILKQLALALSFMVLFTQAAGAESRDNSAYGKKFPLGALLSLTGDCADVGDLSRKGIELAVEDINARGGILGRPVELVLDDTRESSTANAISAYKRLLLNPEIRYIIGPSCSPAGLALAPLVAPNPKVILASPSIGLRQFNESGENIFKLWPYDEDGPKLMAQYALNHGWRSAAIFSSQQAWEDAQGDFFEAEFTRLGGKVVAKVEPLPTETNLQGPALKLVSAKPEVVFLSNYIHHELAGQELAKQGYHGPKLGSLMTSEKAALAKGALEGAISYGYDTAQPFFIERFRARYGRDPSGIGADNAYDLAQLFAAVINENGTDNPALIRKKLREVKDFRGASGLFSIDAQGGVTRKPVLLVVRNSHLVRLEE